jgi:ABC-type uncharacterized transport system fused permease/ATPase subunit
MSGAPLIKRMSQAWLSDKRGQMVLAITCVTFLSVSVRALYVRRKLPKPGATQEGIKGKVGTITAILPNKEVSIQYADGTREDGVTADRLNRKSSSNSNASTEFVVGEDVTVIPKLKSLRRVVKLALLSNKRQTYAYALILSLGVCGRLYCTMKVYEQTGALGKCMSAKDWPAIFRTQITFAMWCMPAAVMNAFVDYTREGLAQALRRGLVNSMQSNYTHTLPSSSGSTLRPLLLTLADGVADPDQRVTVEADKLASGLSKFFLDIVNPFIQLPAVSYKLGSMMGAGPLLQCYSFFGVVGLWARWISPSFSSLSTEVQASEAALRNQHTRVVTHAEQIEFLRGAKAETKLLDRALARVDTSLRSLRTQKLAYTTVNGYFVRYLGILAASSFMMPAIFRASHPSSPPASTHSSPLAGSHDVTQYFLTCLHLLMTVAASCGDVFAALASAAPLRSQVDHVKKF